MYNLIQNRRKQNKLQIIFTTPQVFGEELRSPNSLLLETANEMGAQRIFVDGIGLLNAEIDCTNPDRTGYRELLQQLLESLNRENLTAASVRRQLNAATPRGTKPRHLLRDRDAGDAASFASALGASVSMRSPRPSMHQRPTPSGSE